MKAQELPFRFCPNCGKSNLEFHRPISVNCQDCGFTYYQNNAAAVAIILETPDGILLVKRNKEPEKGRLDLPGGFVDPGEGALEAVKRELMEELHLTVADIRFFSSRPNRYPYNGVLYHTCDLFFIATLTDLSTINYDPIELEGWQIITHKEYDPDEIAFESVSQTLSRYFRDKRAQEKK